MKKKNKTYHTEYKHSFKRTFNHFTKPHVRKWLSGTFKAKKIEKGLMVNMEK